MPRKCADWLPAGLAVLALALYDLVIDIAAGLLHLVFELLHLGFEWFELGIEHVVEHVFHTSRHGSQIVTFYLLLLLAIAALYGLWRAWPRIVSRIMHAVRLEWQAKQAQFAAHWRSLGMLYKFKLLTTAMSLACLVALLI